MNRKRIGGVGAAVLALGAVGGSAYAAIPDSTSGTIAACYASAGTAAGTLKVIGAQSGVTCGAGQTKLTWGGHGWAFNRVSGYHMVQTTQIIVFAHDQGTVAATCAAGEVAIGGGESNDGGFNSVVLTDSFLIPGGWQVYVKHISAAPRAFTPYLICATAS